VVETASKITLVSWRAGTEIPEHPECILQGHRISSRAGAVVSLCFVLPLFACDLPATVLAAREVGANAGSRPGDWLQDPRLPIRHRSTRDENNSYVHSARGIARSGADVFRANALAVNTS